MTLHTRRNPLPLPPIQHEELYSKPISWKGCYPGWEDYVTPHCRLNMHHTLASMRWNYRLRGPLKPQHSLDLALSAIYQHGPDIFSDKSDVIRQPETAGYPTWRLLKNHRHVPNMVPIDRKKFVKGRNQGTIDPVQFGVSKLEQRDEKTKKVERSGRYVNFSHPLRLGGLVERLSPHSVKLGIMSHHNPMSHDGYGRNSYGAFYTS